MRITLSLDDDVVAQLEVLRTKEHLSFEQAVNSALRLGLREMSRHSAPKPFRTTPIDTGECRIPTMDGISAVLAELDDDESTRR